MSQQEQSVERTTAMALAEKKKLVKSLRRFDMLFFTICALVGLDTLGQVSSYGAATFTWVAILAVLFLLPYALVMSELGTAFPQEGGPYEWMKLAWGRLPAGLGAILYWVTNPIWVGGTLALAAASAWSLHIQQIGNASVGGFLFKLIFIWFSIGVAIVSLRRGKWIPNLGAIVRVGVLAFFSITVLIYAIKHGLHGASAGDFGVGSMVVFLSLVPLLLFNYVGFELQNGAAEEMQDPQRDVPITVIGSGVVTAIAYMVPIFGIVFVLPQSAITGISGFLDAVSQTFSVYGSAANFLTDLMALGFIFALVTSGAVWMMGSDRIQAVAAYDGAAPGFFGVFNSTFGTPVRVNVMSGIVSTIFMVAATRLTSGASANEFIIVLYLATSTTLLSYLLIFPAAVKLRMSHGHVHRPYRIPGGSTGLWVCSLVPLAWMMLGSWVAVFPGTLDELFGHSYSMMDSYGVSRLRFEVFTLGALGVILVLGVIGYVLGEPVRRRQADVAFEPPPGPGMAPAVGD
jgi:amino acid transporter